MHSSIRNRKWTLNGNSFRVYSVMNTTETGIIILLLLLGSWGCTKPEETLPVFPCKLLTQTTRRENKLQDSTYYQYDKTGRLARKITYENQSIPTAYTYQYTTTSSETRGKILNQKGLVVEEEVYDADHILRESRVYDYDRWGNGTIILQRITKYNQRGKETEHYLVDATDYILDRTTFEYDAKDRLVRQVRI